MTTTSRIGGNVRVPEDAAPDHRSRRRRSVAVVGSRAGGSQPAEVRGGDEFPDYLPDPLEVGRRSLLVVRGPSEAFAQKLLDRIPGAAMVPSDVPAGSVVFPRVPARGWARRLQTTCKRGHDLARAYVRKDGARVCRQCRRDRKRQSA